MNKSRLVVASMAGAAVLSFAQFGVAADAQRDQANSGTTAAMVPSGAMSGMDGSNGFDIVLAGSPTAMVPSGAVSGMDGSNGFDTVLEAQASTLDPVISDAEADFALSVHSITITGTGFGTLAPRVEIGSIATPLTVTSNSATRVVATLPPSVVPGSYYLTLTTRMVNKDNVTAVGETDSHWVGLEAGTSYVLASWSN